MNTEGIVSSFRDKVCDHINLQPEGLDRYRVVTPFEFDDGDALVVVLRRHEGGWILTDEGHTVMRLTYDIDEADLRRGTRQKIIENTLSAFQVEDRDGEYVLPVPQRRFGDALFSYIQAILKIADVSYLSREQVRSTFLDDFRGFLADVIPAERRVFDWAHPERDPKQIYSVDCRMNGSSQRPLLIFGLPGNGKTRDATISLYKFEKWGMQFRSLAIFEDQERIGRKVLARLTDVCDRQYSSFSGNSDRITRFIGEALTG